MSRNVNFPNFTAEQFAFMVSLADPNDHRTQKEIADELRLRPETLSRWKREPGFGEAVWELTYRNLESELGRVSAVLLKQALEGDVRSLRLFFEVTSKIGAQKASAICTRDHIMSAQEIADGLKETLTERELDDYLSRVKEYYGIKFPGEPEINFDGVSITEAVNLETT